MHDHFREHSFSKLYPLKCQRPLTKGVSVFWWKLTSSSSVMWSGICPLSSSGLSYSTNITSESLKRSPQVVFQHRKIWRVCPLNVSSCSPTHCTMYSASLCLLLVSQSIFGLQIWSYLFFYLRIVFILCVTFCFTSSLIGILCCFYLPRCNVKTLVAVLSNAVSGVCCHSMVQTCEKTDLKGVYLQILGKDVQKQYISWQMCWVCVLLCETSVEDPTMFSHHWTLLADGSICIVTTRLIWIFDNIIIWQNLC